MNAFEAEQEANGLKAAKKGKAFLPRSIEELCSIAGLRL